MQVSSSFNVYRKIFCLFYFVQFIRKLLAASHINIKMSISQIYCGLAKIYCQWSSNYDNNNDISVTINEPYTLILLTHRKNRGFSIQAVSYL